MGNSIVKVYKSLVASAFSPTIVEFHRRVIVVQIGEMLVCTVLQRSPYEYKYLCQIH